MACMGNRNSCRPLVYLYVRPTVETLRYSNYKILSQMVRKRRQSLCKDEIRGNQQGSARLLQWAYYLWLHRGQCQHCQSPIHHHQFIISKLVVAMCSSRWYFLLVIIVTDDPQFIIGKAAVKKRASICKQRWKAEVSLQHTLHVNNVMMSIIIFFFFLLKQPDSKLGAATPVDPIK